MDLALLIVGPEVLNVPSSWHQIFVKPLELVCSRPYYPFDDVWPFPIRPENSNASFFCVGVNFSKDQVALFKSYFLDLRVEISLRSPFV